jgi:predicted exporter
MVRKLAILLAVVMIGILAWQVIGPGDAVSIQINGREITGPFDAIVGVWGLVIAAVTLFCVAILLAFVFAGMALILLGVFALVGLILAAVAFPFLLPLLIPLFIIWLFCLLVRPSRPPRQNS